MKKVIIYLSITIVMCMFFLSNNVNAHENISIEPNGELMYVSKIPYNEYVEYNIDKESISSSGMYELRIIDCIGCAEVTISVFSIFDINTNVYIVDNNSFVEIPFVMVQNSNVKIGLKSESAYFSGYLEVHKQKISIYSFDEGDDYDINTRTDYEQFIRNDYLDYYEIIDDANKTKSDALNTISSDIVYFSGHGSYNNSTKKGSIKFSKSTDLYGSDLTKKETYNGIFLNTSKMTNTKLAIISACDQGFEGGIAEEFVRHGAKCAIGFTKKVQVACARWFCNNLFENLEKGLTVTEAVNKSIVAGVGKSDVKVYGDGSITLDNYDNAIFKEDDISNTLRLGHTTINCSMMNRLVFIPEMTELYEISFSNVNNVNIIVMDAVTDEVVGSNNVLLKTELKQGHIYYILVINSSGNNTLSLNIAVSNNIIFNGDNFITLDLCCKETSNYYIYTTSACDTYIYIYHDNNIIYSFDDIEYEYDDETYIDYGARGYFRLEEGKLYRIEIYSRDICVINYSLTIK